MVMALVKWILSLPKITEPPPQINLKYKQGGSFNFKDKVLRGLNYTSSQLSFRISDHLPLWAEFEI